MRLGHLRLVPGDPSPSSRLPPSPSMPGGLGARAAVPSDTNIKSRTHVPSRRGAPTPLPHPDDLGYLSPENAL